MIECKCKHKLPQEEDKGRSRKINKNLNIITVITVITTVIKVIIVTVVNILIKKHKEGRNNRSSSISNNTRDCSCFCKL